MPAIAEQTSPRGSGVTRDAILTAALTLFLQRGFAATRVEDIAQIAGVGKGSVYLHFRNKEELFQAVIDEGIVASLEQAEAAATDFAGSATELLASMLHNNLVEFWGRPASGVYKLIIAESQHFPELSANYYRMVTQRARKLLESILQLGIDRGEYRAMDVVHTARFILGALDNELILAHSLAAHAGDKLEAHRYIDALLQVVTTGVALPDARPKPDSAGDRQL